MKQLHRVKMSNKIQWEFSIRTQIRVRVWKPSRIQWTQKTLRSILMSLALQYQLQNTSNHKTKRHLDWHCMSTEKSLYSRRLSNAQRNLIDWKLIRKSSRPHRPKLCSKERITTRGNNHLSAKVKTHIYAPLSLIKTKRWWKWLTHRENLLLKETWSKVLTQWRGLRSVKLSWSAQQVASKWLKYKTVLAIAWKTIIPPLYRQTMTKSLPQSWQPRLQTMHHHAVAHNINFRLTVRAFFPLNWAKSPQKPHPMKKAEFLNQSTLPQIPRKPGTRHKPVPGTKSNSIDWEQFRICQISRKRVADITEAQAMTDMAIWHQF